MFYGASMGAGSPIMTVDKHDSDRHHHSTSFMLIFALVIFIIFAILIFAFMRRKDGDGLEAVSGIVAGKALDYGNNRGYEKVEIMQWDESRDNLKEHGRTHEKIALQGEKTTDYFWRTGEKIAESERRTQEKIAAVAAQVLESERRQLERENAAKDAKIAQLETVREVRYVPAEMRYGGCYGGQYAYAG